MHWLVLYVYLGDGICLISSTYVSAVRSSNFLCWYDDLLDMCPTFHHRIVIVFFGFFFFLGGGGGFHDKTEFNTVIFRFFIIIAMSEAYLPVPATHRPKNHQLSQII